MSARQRGDATAPGGENPARRRSPSTDVSWDDPWGKGDPDRALEPDRERPPSRPGSGRTVEPGGPVEPDAVGGGAVGGGAVGGGAVGGSGVGELDPFGVRVSDPAVPATRPLDIDPWGVGAAGRAEDIAVWGQAIARPAGNRGGRKAGGKGRRAGGFGSPGGRVTSGEDDAGPAGSADDGAPAAGSAHDDAGPVGAADDHAGSVGAADDHAGSVGAADDHAGSVGAADDDARAAGSTARTRSGGRRARSSPREGSQRNELSDSERAREICLRQLSVRPRTRVELAGAMRKARIPDDVAADVLERYGEVGLIDDAAFARAWVTSRHHGKGLARRALAGELRRKGVEQEAVGEALDELDPATEEATARELVARRLRGERRDRPDATLRRLVGMLARKGYPPGLAIRIVKDAMAADADDSEYAAQIDVDALVDAAEAAESNDDS